MHAVRHLLGIDRAALERPANRPPVRTGSREPGVSAYQDLAAGAESERVQRALYRISEAAHTAPSLQALFSELHAVVGDLMPARNFYIALHDPATDTLSFPYFVDEKDPPPAPRRLRKGLTEFVLRSGQALLDRPGVYAELVRRGEVESIGAASSDWLGVPLKTGDRTIGVLTAQSYDEVSGTPSGTATSAIRLDPGGHGHRAQTGRGGVAGVGG
jgi:transcriptional regulator with GAF, ATPase, and Fis domain